MAAAAPRAFETGAVSGFLAMTPNASTLSVRVRRASTHFFCGTATHMALQMPVGFGGSIHGRFPAVALYQTAVNGNTYILDFANGILELDRNSFLVLGSGQVQDTAGTTQATGPAIAVVVGGCCTQVVVGNGDPAGSPGEVYSEAIWAPAGASLLVTGTQNSQACVRRLDPTTFMALPLTFSTTALSVMFSAASENATEGRSLALTNGNSLLVVAVMDDVAANTVVWTLCADTLATLPPSATQYNDPGTGYVRAGPGGTGLAPVRVLGTPAGDLWLVGRQSLDAASDPSLPLPNLAAAVYRFNADTSPDLDFGMAGVLLYYPPPTPLQNHVYATDAALTPMGSVLVCGNTGLYTGSAFSITDAFLPAFMLETASAPLPTPFVVEVSTKRRPRTILADDALECGCAPMHWASCLARDSTTGTLYVLGDSNFHPFSGTLAQPNLLLLVIQNCTVTNAYPVCVPPMQTLPGGLINVDLLCGPTSLVVNGVLVLANGMSVSESESESEPLPLPGSIRFNSTTSTFQGFNGTAWVTFGASP